MGKKTAAKTSAEIELERLESGHGKQWVKLSEIDCKIMRTDAKIEGAIRRGGLEATVDILRAIVTRLLFKRSEVLVSLEVTRSAIPVRLTNGAKTHQPTPSKFAE